MNFNNKLNMKRIVLTLVGIMLVSFGIGFLIIAPTWESLVKSTKGNYYIDADRSIKLKEVKKIDVNVDTATINVIPKDSDEVRAHLYGKFYTNPELQCYISGSTLYIVEKNKSNFNINLGFSNKNTTLDVYVPASYSEDMKLTTATGGLNISGFKLNKLECNPSLGRANINKVTAKTFNYDNGTGDLSAVSLHTQDSNIKASLGKIDISDFTGNLKASNSSGDTKIQYSTYDNNNVDINASLGKVQLQLPQKSEFYLDAKASLGKISCDFPITVIGSKEDHQLQGTVGSNKNQVKINVSTGDISVNYN